MNVIDLERIHQRAFKDDIPFWTTWTKGRDPVLELGCADGRVTLALAAEGHQILGLDNDWMSLRQMVSNLKKDYQNLVMVVQADMIQFQTSQVFGAVILPCNTYSTFPTRQRQILCFNIYRMLRPEGLFIVSLPNPKNLQSIYNDLLEYGEQEEPDLEDEFTHPETGFPIQVKSRLGAKRDCLQWDWLYDHLYPDGRVERTIRSTEHQLCSLGGYQADFRDAGFNIIACLGDFNGEEYEDKSPYLILVGERK